jgi:adenosylmethionine-8-amino-7-oxononanoate aminotransferase
MFFHSSSYTANPIACAAANANLAIWREEPVLERIADLAATPGGAAGVGSRSCPRRAMPGRWGTITAFDLVDERGAGYLALDSVPSCWRISANADLLLRPLGNTVYVMPPYCIDDADLGRTFLG